MDEARKLWKRNVNRFLETLDVTEEERKRLNFLNMHAVFRYRRRKWETHNKIQNLVRNRKRCTEIYEALPLLCGN